MNFNFVHLINYLAKGLIVLLGILLVSGVLLPNNPDPTFTNIMGIIMILYGTFRIVIYKAKRKIYKGKKNDED